MLGQLIVALGLDAMTGQGFGITKFQGTLIALPRALERRCSARPDCGTRYGRGRDGME